MNRVIYRVDDRFIHGQVLEGWINYLKISDVLIVNDVIASDDIRMTIYKSTIPLNVRVSFYSIHDFLNLLPIKKLKKRVLVLLGSIEDLLKLETTYSKDIYFNIGCLSSGSHEISLNDTVFMSQEELNYLKNIFKNDYVLNVHKVPWEKAVLINSDNPKY